MADGNNFVLKVRRVESCVPLNWERYRNRSRKWHKRVIRSSGDNVDAEIIDLMTSSPEDVGTEETAQRIFPEPSVGENQQFFSVLENIGCTGR